MKIQTVVLIALFVTLAAPRSTEANCRIAAKVASLGTVEVRAGGGTFKISPHRVAVTVTPITARVGTVFVRSPLRFVLRGYNLSKVSVMAGKSLSLAGGRLRLARSVKTNLVKVRNGFAYIKPELLGLSLRKPVRVRCRSLTVASSAGYSSPQYAGASTKARLAAPAKFFALYRSARGGRPIWVKVSGPVSVNEHKNGRVRVRLDWTDGSSLRGWAPKSQITGRYIMGGGLGGGYGTGGACARGSRTLSVSLRANAPIATRAAGAIWAHTAKKIAVKLMALSRSDGWARIAELPGIRPYRSCYRHDHMWVHARYIIWKKPRK